ncbi:TonB-dependent receptor [Novosphingobium sp. ERN07]|uniref:TonB-dependent receptor n=1 Tax=Novosphingobium sp. ERN07 TaxID=2726187 RepID=UPI001456DE53|nr:TonB-dependent receptor [Novosphingobium sp. ERN07]NLR72398.1 TonB-dependent receptor [Novosphingobium sp. ERN07]
MRGKLSLLAGVCIAAVSAPVFAQEAPQTADDNFGLEEIIVTAQRQAQRLQDVPIAVSAFSPEALDKQQIRNTLDLQLSLPNITFTKTNFTSSSFTIRGIGDLCVGVTCDQATAIHLNDSPLFATRLFEGEFYDLAQVQVLRGPQGTLFGRNATSGVVDLITAKPDLSAFGASGDAEYGNYDSVRLRGMVNLPLGASLGVRLAGFYLNREGYTKNLFDNSRIDDRNMYSVRGSLRFEPGTGTTIDLMAQYFHERDNRMRIQKQVCQTDPTGILGCLNANLPYGTTNGNSTLASVLGSREFFAIRGLPTAFASGSLYGTDTYSGVVNPADPRVVNTDTKPSYFTEELIVVGSWDQELGGGLNLKLTGNYQDVKVDSSQDYNNSVQSRALIQPSLNTLAAAQAGLLGAGLQRYLGPVAAALMPNGPAGVICTSAPVESGTGVFGGNRVCGMTPLDFDRSVQYNKSWSAEAIFSSDWDGKFNFLLGGIYSDYSLSENSYYVNSFGLDYFTGVVGAFSALGAGAPPSYLATPYFRNNSDQLDIKSYGIFGEAYYKFDDRVKLTLGLRYNNDDKKIRARTTLANFLTPFGTADVFSSPFAGSFDADPSLAGNQLFQNRSAKFKEITGRAVLDFQITPDNLVYLSYSRGYKSGGINPPLSPIFTVPESFNPEFIDAFEIGTKNQFGGLTLNLTGFYYKYKGLQLSRIVARTSVNDNVNANIWGLEAEAVMRPVRGMTVNVSASYLNTKVSQDKFLANPRDFGAGRADAVIIKDITNAANCAVASTSGSVAGVNAFVNTVNAQINAGAIPGVAAGAGLRPTTSFGANSGIASTGAYSICAALEGVAAATGGGAPFGGVQVFTSGIPVNIKGNQLPGAPNVKVSGGAEYAIPLGGLTLTPRADFIMTGTSTGSIFNGNINRIPSYTQVNAQIQLDGPENKWFLRGFIQNVGNSNPITGLYITDQSSGNFTNIFTLEPRRYGVAAGFKF